MSASQNSALVDKQEAYIRIKKMLYSVDPEKFPDKPLGDGDDNDWSYILVWYYTFDKPWLWASQAASVARSSPLKSKAFREHFTMLKIDSELDDLGAAFRHLQQSLVGFEKKLGRLKRDKALTKLEPTGNLKEYVQSQRSDKQELKVKNIVKNIMDKYETNPFDDENERTKEVFNFITLYQSGFLDNGVIKSSHERVVKKVEHMRSSFDRIREAFANITDNTDESTESEIEIVTKYAGLSIIKTDGGILEKKEGEKIDLVTYKIENEQKAKKLMEKIVQNGSLTQAEQDELGELEKQLISPKKYEIGKDVASWGVAVLSSVMAYYYSASFWATSTLGIKSSVRKGLDYLVPTVTPRWVVAAYLDATANNIHALASYILSYELK